MKKQAAEISKLKREIRLKDKKITSMSEIILDLREEKLIDATTECELNEATKSLPNLLQKITPKGVRPDGGEYDLLTGGTSCSYLRLVLRVIIP